MGLDITGIQKALAREKIDGWLLYDFHGSNPVATRITGLDRAGKMATALGYRLSYWLVPVNPPPLPEGSDDG